MKNLFTLLLVVIIGTGTATFSQTLKTEAQKSSLAQWTHSSGKGGFTETERRAANNQPIWQESGQFNYEELSRTASEVLLKDINGRSDMQVKITNDACYWKYPNDANWNMLYSGSWTVKPIVISSALAIWTHSNGSGGFAQTERIAANNQPIWQESGQLNYEELSRTASEVLLKDINGRSDMQVKITSSACYWKYPNDANWNMLYSGSWTVKPNSSVTPVSGETNSPINSMNTSSHGTSNQVSSTNSNITPTTIPNHSDNNTTNSTNPVTMVGPTPTFKTVQIGTQTWMADNLNVDRFRNGDLIPEAKSEEEWKKAIENKQPVFAHNINDKEKKYGKYYNFYAATDLRGLCPVGWRIPTYDDFLTLTRFLGEEVAGKKLKSTTGWRNVDHMCNHCAHWTENQKDYNICPVCNNSRKHGSHSGNGDNSSGFNAFSLPVDMRYPFGDKTVFFGKITGIQADLMGVYYSGDGTVLLRSEQFQGSTPSILRDYMIFRLIKE